MSSHQTSIAWPALPGPARTLLYVIARRERDGYSTTRSDIREVVTTPQQPQLTDQELLGSYQALEDAGLIATADPLAPYELTPNGRDLLASHALRLESTTDTPAPDQVDTLAVCPRCNNPITELLANPSTGNLTPSFCECPLTGTAVSPPVATLLDVYPSINDRDAVHYLRQAIYLLLSQADA